MHFLSEPIRTAELTSVGSGCPSRRLTTASNYQTAADQIRLAILHAATGLAAVSAFGFASPLSRSPPDCLSGFGNTRDSEIVKPYPATKVGFERFRSTYYLWPIRPRDKHQRDRLNTWVTSQVCYLFEGVVVKISFLVYWGFEAIIATKCPSLGA